MGIGLVCGTLHILKLVRVAATVQPVAQIGHRDVVQMDRLVERDESLWLLPVSGGQDRIVAGVTPLNLKVGLECTLRLCARCDYPELPDFAIKLVISFIEEYKKTISGRKLDVFGLS